MVVDDPRHAYEVLLLRLHALDRRGELDSAEADALREEMDPLWAELDESERRLMADLSESLYGEVAATEDGDGDRRR